MRPLPSRVACRLLSAVVAVALTSVCAIGAAACTVADDDEIARGQAEVTADSDASAGAFTVTYIGDSHSDYENNAVGAFGYLGYHLKELLAAAPLPLAMYAASGSAPVWWFDDTATQAATWGYTQTVSNPARRTCYRGQKAGTCVPKLGVLTSTHPSLFVVEQGTNLLGRSTSDITQEIQKLLQQVAGKVGSCLWVGAPNARTDVHSQPSQDQLWQLIQANAAPTCTVYDSRFVPRTDAAGHPVLDAQGNLIIDVPLPYSPDANNDGEHLGTVAAGKWATGVAQMIELLASRAPHATRAAEATARASD